MTNLTNQQKLEKLIQKAIDGGWEAKGNFRYLEQMGVVERSDPSSNVISVYVPQQIIFNHDFAKALVGDAVGYCYFCMEGAHEAKHVKDEDRIGVRDDCMYEWQYHLQQAVIADDPINYIYEQVFGNE